MFMKKKERSDTGMHPQKAKQTFYINIPRAIQREVRTEERKNRTTLIQKQKKEEKEEGNTKIKSLKS